jgi:hypothetical protein
MPPRSKRRSRGPNGRWIIALLGGGGLLALLAVMTPALFMGWVRHQLQDTSFRGRLEALTGSRLDAQVQIAPLHWSGDEVRTASAGIVLADGTRAEVHGLHLGIDWAAFRRGLWHIIDAGADRLDLELAGTSAAAEPSAPAESTTTASAGPALPGWLRSWLPDRTSVDGVRVQRFSLRHPGGWQLTGANLAISPWQQNEASLLTTLQAGSLTTPLRSPASGPPLQFDLVHAVTRLTPGEVHLQESVLRRGGAEWRARGHLRSTDPVWQTDVEFQRVPLADWVAVDWRQRLTGELAGELSLNASGSAPPQGKGRLWVQNGVLTALPVLDRLAAWSGVERFKRLVLDVAEAQVSASADEQVFDPVVLAAHGLLRLQGRLTVRGDQLDGQFWLGVTPETLRWLPGAREHVFTETAPDGPPGLRWTRVHVSGTRQAPREDLSQRLVEGAGKAALALPAEVAAQGGSLLLEPVLGKEAAQPDALLKNATDAVGKALESGARLLEPGSRATRRAAEKRHRRRWQGSRIRGASAGKPWRPARQVGRPQVSAA